MSGDNELVRRMTAAEHALERLGVAERTVGDVRLLRGHLFTDSQSFTSSSFTAVNSSFASVTKRLADSNLLVVIFFGAFRNSATAGRLEVRAAVGSTKGTGVAGFHFNTNAEHHHWTRYSWLTGLAAGAHTVSLEARQQGGTTIQIDTADFLGWLCLEIPSGITL